MNKSSTPSKRLVFLSYSLKKCYVDTNYTVEVSKFTKRVAIIINYLD
jgi:hypothetical protein